MIKLTINTGNTQFLLCNYFKKLVDKITQFSKN